MLVFQLINAIGVLVYLFSFVARVLIWSLTKIKVLNTNNGFVVKFYRYTRIGHTVTPLVYIAGIVFSGLFFDLNIIQSIGLIFLSCVLFSTKLSNIILMFFTFLIASVINPNFRKNMVDMLRGNIFDILKKYDRAIFYYTKCIAYEPDNPSIYYLRSRVYAKSNEINKALHDMDMFIGLNREHVKSKDFLERSYLHSKTKNYAKAIEDLTRVINIEPGDYKSLFLRAREYGKLSEYQKQIEDYNKVIDLRPNSAIAYNNRGYTYYKMGEYKLAMVDYDKALSIDPNLILATNNKNNLTAKKVSNIGNKDLDIKWDDVLNDITYPVSSNQNSLATKSVLDSESCNVNDGLQDLTRAIELNPSDSKSYLFRAEAYYYKDEFLLAIKDLDEAINIDPQYTYAYEWRAFIYSVMDDHAKVVDDATIAINLSKDNVYAYYLRGQAYSYLNEFKNCIEDQTRAINLNERCILAYSYRACAYGFIGQFQNAIEDYTKIIELDPDDQWAYRNRGICYGLLERSGKN